MLGPLLFLIYINDLTDSLCTCKTSSCTKNCRDLASFILYADDTNIFINEIDINSVITKTNTILSKIMPQRYLLVVSKRFYLKSKKPGGTSFFIEETYLFNPVIYP